MLSHCPSLPKNDRYLSVCVVRHPLVEEVVRRFGLGQETDDSGENVVACAFKVIVISDNLAAYEWIVNIIYSMSVLPCSVPKLVFGDRIISANQLKDMGIQNTAKLILNKYHLK